MADQPELLSGFLSSVVRRGDVLDRPAGASTPAVQALLGHIARVRPGLAPRPLGYETPGGVERVEFIEGDVAGGGAVPPYVWLDETLAALARLLGELHDATVGFRPPEGARWRTDAAHPAGGEVVCHNDVAPWNTVFRGQRPVALIDWDLAAPGPRLWDVSFAIWHFVPFYGGASGDPFEPGTLGPRGRRARLFCDAYGLADRAAVVPTLLERMTATLETIRERAAAGEAAYVRLRSLGAPEGVLEQRAFVECHRELIEAELV